MKNLCTLPNFSQGNIYRAINKASTDSTLSVL